MHCDLFDNYCAPPNLVVRTWICQLNFAQRLLRLEVLQRAWNLRLGAHDLKSLPEDLWLGFLNPKKSTDLSRVWTREPWISRRAGCITKFKIILMIGLRKYTDTIIRHNIMKINLTDTPACWLYLHNSKHMAHAKYLSFSYVKRSLLIILCVFDRWWRYLVALTCFTTPSSIYLLIFLFSLK